MAENVHHHTFSNGLTVLLERMEDVRSAALNFLVPAGCVYDPPEYRGIGSVLAEMITRGAGPRNSRELSLALDNLGLDRSESVSTIHMRFWGATLARNLPAALDLYADILRRPHLNDDEVEAVRDLALQDLQAVEDEPRTKVLIELRQRHLPYPLGLDRRGTVEGLEQIHGDAIRAHHRRLFRPGGSILSVAGNVQWEPLLEQVGHLFGDWPEVPDPGITLGPRGEKRAHLHKDITQTHIALACDSVPIGTPHYYNALGAVNVLSGGMSARLFTEVREKRGLCYSVWASYQTFKDRASILAYAGTTTERAQQTLDVTLKELQRLAEGIEVEEVERVRAGLKSSLILQQESTSARAGSLASDWYYLGRVRTVDEIQQAIDNLTAESILAYLREYPLRDFTVVTLGREPLKVTE